MRIVRLFSPLVFLTWPYSNDVQGDQPPKDDRVITDSLLRETSATLTMPLSKAVALVDDAATADGEQ